MKKYRFSSKYLIFNCALHLLGIVLFISGFLPLKKSLQGYSNHEDIPFFTEDVKIQMKTKVVFIVIDALRADFIPSISSNSSETTMPYLEELVSNGSALPFISVAHSPTVTLPRIKAMMSGTIPAFLDVIFNLHASRSHEDSVLYQAHRAKHKILFYGDDTWVKLYKEYFHTFEGTTSFFVNDFIEVDHNVTRHLDKVLKDLSWDLLILHYLGLDHIGHLSGHQNSFVKPKLKEMDNVIKRIHSVLKNESHMIVVTGDHGMTAAGSHGGSSPAETLTPLIFISKHLVKTEAVEQVMQNDIAPTLSALMGLPIPKNSVGRIIPSVLEKLGLQHQVILKALFRNTLQVSKVLKANQVLSTQYSLDDVVNDHRGWLQDPNENNYIVLKDHYLSLMKSMSQKIATLFSGYDVYSMVIGFVTVFSALLSTSKRSCAKGVALIEEEMFYIKLMIFVPSVIVSSGIQFLFCMENSHHFCSSVWSWLIPVIILSYFFYNIIQCSYLLPSLLSEKTFTIGIEFFVVVSSVFHVISLGSSSFVEEEHQTWYFFTTTLIILLFLRTVNQMIRSFDITLEIGFLQRSSPGNFAVYRHSLLVKMSHCLGFLLLARICRSWNQTGNKWAHLPDIGDYLQSNKMLLSFTSVISMALLLSLLRTHRIVQQCCLLLSLLGTLAYHLESVEMSGVSTSKQVIAWFVYAGIVVHTVETAWHVLVKIEHRCSRIKKCELLLNGVTTSWLLLVLLLCRTHNIPLFLFMVLQEKLLQKLVQQEPMPFFVRASAYLWTSMCAFFYQGNSNMISTLDVSAGYVGLSSYKPIIVGFLMVCNTYSGLVYFLLRYVTQLCRTTVTQDQASSVQNTSVAVLLCVRLLSGTMYLAVLIYLRHHLFIWTVFTPKLLYEGVHSIVFTFFVLLILFIAKITRRGST